MVCQQRKKCRRTKRVNGIVSGSHRTKWFHSRASSLPRKLAALILHRTNAWLRRDWSGKKISCLHLRWRWRKRDWTYSFRDGNCFELNSLRSGEMVVIITRGFPIRFINWTKTSATASDHFRTAERASRWQAVNVVCIVIAMDEIMAKAQNLFILNLNSLRNIKRFMKMRTWELSVRFGWTQETRCASSVAQELGE